MDEGLVLVVAVVACLLLIGGVVFASFLMQSQCIEARGAWTGSSCLFTEAMP